MPWQQREVCSVHNVCLQDSIVHLRICFVAQISCIIVDSGMFCCAFFLQSVLLDSFLHDALFLCSVCLDCHLRVALLHTVHLDSSFMLLSRIYVMFILIFFIMLTFFVMFIFFMLLSFFVMFILILFFMLFSSSFLIPVIFNFLYFHVALIPTIFIFLAVILMT